MQVGTLRRSQLRSTERKMGQRGVLPQMPTEAVMIIGFIIGGVVGFMAGAVVIIAIAVPRF